jgi:hypothetical protein
MDETRRWDSTWEMKSEEREERWRYNHAMNDDDVDMY